MSNQPRVGIIMGSQSDYPKMVPAEDFLRELNVLFESRVLSAHRTPELVAEYARTAYDRRVLVIIAAAGGAAHLGGALAAVAVTTPIVAVPIDSKLGGEDSLLSMVQMPPGVPVGVMAIDGAKNAAIYAAQILAVADASLSARLHTWRYKESEKRAADTEPKLPLKKDGEKS